LLLRLAGAQFTLTRAAGTAGGVSVRIALCEPPLSDAVTVTVSVEGTPVMVAVNPAEDCPAATVTEAGVLTLALESLIATSVLDGAGATSVSEQAAVPADEKALGPQLRPERPAGATRFSDAVRVTPLNEAVRVTVWLAEMAAAFTLKDPLEAPLGMLTAAGTDNTALPPARAIVAVPVAAFDRTTVQAADWLELNVAGEQAREESVAGAVRARLVLRVPPLRLAVMETLSSAGTPVTVAVNCALPCPADTVTDAGTATLALPSDKPTVVLPAAVAVSVTVQTALPGAENEEGAQLRELSAAGAAATKLIVAVRVTPVNPAVITTA
jgi:hypothetical protein